MNDSYYLLFAGYYEDETHDDLYAVDQQSLRLWANLINVVSTIIIIIKENIFKIHLRKCAYIYVYMILRLANAKTM